MYLTGHFARSCHWSRSHCSQSIRPLREFRCSRTRTLPKDCIGRCGQNRMPYEDNWNMWVQSISVIRPAVLTNQNGPYKQYGPISDVTGPLGEMQGLIKIEMWNKALKCPMLWFKLTRPSGDKMIYLTTENNLKLLQIHQLSYKNGRNFGPYNQFLAL